jgi:hypothetical protein
MSGAVTFACWIVAAPAWAQPSPSPSPGPLEPSAAEPSPSPAPERSAIKPTPKSASLDFDLFSDKKLPPPLPPSFDRRVQIRRAMLKTHQALGFITLGLLAASLVLGQLDYYDKYGGGGDTGRYLMAHAGLSGLTTLTFAATGITALAAPNPYPKPIRFDGALVHKLSMALATAGMLTQIILGPITATRDGQLDQRDYARVHLGIGWATFGFMAAGVLAYVFK